MLFGLDAMLGHRDTVLSGLDAGICLGDLGGGADALSLDLGVVLHQAFAEAHIAELEPVLALFGLILALVALHGQLVALLASLALVRHLGELEFGLRVGSLGLTILVLVGE